jgi:predicted peptidase
MKKNSTFRALLYALIAACVLVLALISCKSTQKYDRSPIVFGTDIDPVAQMAESRELARTVTISPLPDSRKNDRHYTYFFEEACEASPFRVCIPSGWDGKSKLPMVVFLHGAFNTESSYLDQNDQQMVKLADEYGVLLVSPLGCHGAYGTFLKLPGSFGRDEENAAILNDKPTQERMTSQRFSEKDVINVIELVLANFPVDRSRMFLTGHSMGSGGTWYIGAKYPDYWKALAPMSGPFVTEEGYPWSNIKKKPIFITEGSFGCATTDSSRELYDWMKQRGFKVSYKEYEGDHGQMVILGLRDVYEFFKANI